MNYVAIWLVVLVILLIIEMVTMGLTTIWFAGGALAAALLALADMPVALQLLAFLMISLILLFSTRPLALNYFNRDRVKTNVDELIGKQAIVLTEINNLKGSGKASLNGMEWSARAVSDTEIIPAGTVVNIRAIQGVKLIVEEKAMIKEKEKKEA
ncbi:MAG: NfeD family protein [Lachnospiraceae bacterium]|nr:NfeD family protein [Lachnospiraceae bacterium]MCI7595952.1 NfeD family protein [Lachnospiraceae bacterium]MDD7051691.1 NfeD family protein [Lachnospiraceae bacterium]MDY3222534.1 NfeD family protein [Lachnospiraceae bacterium]